MNPFEHYPNGGTELLGMPRYWDNCRHQYGLEVQWMTQQNACAYCGISFVDDYYHWLLMAVDHVVPQGEAKRLGIPGKYTCDFINNVICCSGCNSFNNRYKVEREPQEKWTLQDFVALRDEVFADRLCRIRRRRDEEIDFFESKPWENRSWDSVGPRTVDR